MTTGTNNFMANNKSTVDKWTDADIGAHYNTLQQ